MSFASGWFCLMDHHKTQLQDEGLPGHVSCREGIAILDAQTCELMDYDVLIECSMKVIR